VHELWVMRVRIMLTFAAVLILAAVGVRGTSIEVRAHAYTNTHVHAYTCENAERAPMPIRPEVDLQVARVSVCDSVILPSAGSEQSKRIKERPDCGDWGTNAAG
jgi:hypothetical protein